MGLQEQEIIGTVRTALARDPKIDAPRITITMLDGQVGLSGVLDDLEQVQRAAQVVQQVLPGVTIDNGLTAAKGADLDKGEDRLRSRGNKAGAQNQPVRDTLELDIKHALTRAGLPVANIAVFVTPGLVSIAGDVATINHKRQAMQIASQLAGADHRVDVNLNVTSLRRS